MKGYGEYHRNEWLKCHRKIQDVLMAAATHTYMGSLEEKTGSSRRVINKHLCYFMKKGEVVKHGRKIYWKPNYQGYQIFSQMVTKLLALLEKHGINPFEFLCSHIFMFDPEKKGDQPEMNLTFCRIDEVELDLMVENLKEKLGFTKR